jgi:hypothetical protein
VDKVGEQLPSIATTVASLILVFMGLIFTAWDGYEPVEKNAVRAKFRRRLWIAFGAFLCAILSAALGLIGLGTSHKYLWLDYIGTVLLALSALLMIWVAFVDLLEL